MIISDRVCISLDWKVSKLKWIIYQRIFQLNKYIVFFESTGGITKNKKPYMVDIIHCILPYN